MRTENFQETLEAIRADFITDFSMVDLAVKATRIETVAHQRNMEAKTEANRREFQSQLEGVKAVADQGSRPAACVSMAQPPKFDETISWAVFWRQFEIVAEHIHWSHQENLTYLITALKSWAADVLHSIPTNVTYEESLQALEDRFVGQQFATTVLET
jgi:hypothetical protein